MSAALLRYRAAVELENARGTLRLAVRARRQTQADYLRVQDANAAWTKARGGVQ